MSTPKVMKAIHAFEQLSAIEKATGDEKLGLLALYGKAAPLSFLLSLNFNSKVKLAIPEGMPPLDARELDDATHPDFIGRLSTNIHRLKYCLENSTLTKAKREQMFIEVCLNCPLKDAEIICSAKDKALTELYPSITAELVKSVFPAYVG